MKVLHISTSLTGGAALATLRLHEALLDCGVDSRVLTLDEEQNDVLINQYKPLINFQNNKVLSKLLKSLLYHFNIGTGRYWRMHDNARKGHDCVYSYPISPYRIENHPLVKWADIIHLHWCNNFINYPSFFKKIKKPIVWTFHDISIGYGGFHFKRDHDTLLPYYQQLENEFLAIKRKALAEIDNLTIISLSEEMSDFIQNIDFLKNKTSHIIPNSVNTSLFQLSDKHNCRELLNLPKDKTILLFVSEYVQTPSKGLYLLKQAISEIEHENTLVCIVGNYDKEMPKEDIIDTQYFGKITDTNVLSQLYSASDYLVVPSFQEVCPQTPLESMACGTPVVVFPTGAMKDYVTSEVGVVCKDCTVEALKVGLSQAMQSNYDHSSIRQYVSDNFNPTKIAQEHIDVYKSVLE